MFQTTSRGDAGFSITELIIATAITSIVAVFAVNFYTDFVKSETLAEAAAAAERDIDSFEKLIKTRWAQRERPLSPATDMPGDFTRRVPGFSWERAVGVFPDYPCNRNANNLGPWNSAGSCYEFPNALTAINNAQGFGCAIQNRNCIGAYILVSTVTAAKVRDAEWLRIERRCQNFPQLARFNYFANGAVNAPSNPCRCATATSRSRVNQILVNDLGRVIEFPAPPGNAYMRKTHSMTACLDWNRPPAAPPAVAWQPGQPLNSLNIHVEAAYLGAGEQVKFLRKTISLPINQVAETSDAVQR